MAADESTSKPVVEIVVDSRDIRRLWPRPLLDLASRGGATDPFEKPYWSRLQVELWVCTRSRDAVRLAEHAPGSTRLLDLDDDDHGPVFDDETELIGTAISSYGSVCPLDDARREIVVARADGRLRAYPDRHSNSEFFKREDVLALWPDPLRQSARTEPLTVAEAVAQLIRGRSSRKPASQGAWQRLRRRYGGKFPGPIGRRIDEAGAEFIRMICDLGVEAWGRPCIRHGGTGGMVSTGGVTRITDNRAFLAEPLWADPCADAIWTEAALNDGSFNPTDRGYREVHLDRRQFLAAIKAPRESVSPARSNQA